MRDEDFGGIELGVRSEELNKFGMLISDCGIIKNKGTKKNLSALRALSGEKLRIAEVFINRRARGERRDKIIKSP